MSEFSGPAPSVFYVCGSSKSANRGRESGGRQRDRERESQKVAKIVKNKGETEEQPLSVGQNCFSVPWGRLPSSANYKKFNYKLL